MSTEDEALSLGPELEELFSQRLEADVKKLEKLKAAAQRLEARIEGARKAEVRRLERKLRSEGNDGR